MATAVTQIDEVHFRQLERMLDAERQLRQVAESRAAEARQALYEIAEGFCSEALDAILRKRKAEVRGWTPGQLREFIFQHLSPRIRSGVQAGDRLGKEYETAQKQVEELRAQLVEREEAIRERDARIQRVESELRAAQEALSDATRRVAASTPTPAAAIAAARNEPPPKAVEVVQSPGDWFDEWQRHKHHERSRDLIRILGESGICRRPVLRERLNETWDVSSKDAMRNAVELAKRYELIEVLRPEWEGRGRPPQLLRLTDQGREAFLLLFNKEAAPSELDALLERHKGLEHVLLNLEAADVLRERLDAAVDMYPPRIVLDGGRQFVPDLAATLPDGEVIYVECERSKHRDLEAWNRKWQNIYDATGGRLYLICPDYSTRSAITSQLSKWRGGRQIQICATDLTTLRKRADRFWFYQRKH